MQSKLLISKNKILISIVVLILVVVGFLAFYKTYKVNNSPTRIVSDIINANEYQTKVFYIIKNSRGEFKEEATINHLGNETKLTFNDKEQIFSKDTIKINYFEGDKNFTLDKSFDEFYRFFLLNELPQYLGKDTSHTIQDNLIVFTFDTNSDNENFTKCVFTIDLENKVPKSMIIYDKLDKDRVVITYEDYQSKNSL